MRLPRRANRPEPPPRAAGLLAFAWRALISCVAFRFSLHAPQQGCSCRRARPSSSTSGCSTR
eukprot:583939-Prymnesium_polylepis.1